jgi:hypothetical protein
MRGRFPIDVTRAIERLVRPNAIEIAALSAFHCGDEIADGREQALKSRLRVEARVDDCVMTNRDRFAPLREAKRKARGELECALLVTAAAWKVKLDRFLSGHSRGDQGEV